MPRDFTDITMILDRSGSMSTIKEGTLGGFNEFVQEQKKVPGDGCWTLVQFDDQYEVVYAGRSQNDVPLLTDRDFQPCGCTALIDAVCRTIDQTGIRLAALPESQRPSKVLVVIMTDGLENHSREYTRHQMAERIAHQRDKYGWTFVFLGANQDAIAEAGKYGIDARFAMTYQATNAGSGAVLRSLNVGTRQWKLDGNDTAAAFFVDPKPDVNVSVAVKP